MESASNGRVISALRICVGLRVATDFVFVVVDVVRPSLQPELNPDLASSDEVKDQLKK